MATYDLANGDTVTRSPIEELQWDLSRAIGNNYAMASVLTEDLAAILALFSDVKTYLTAAASNDNAANELLQRMERQ